MIYRWKHIIAVLIIALTVIFLRFYQLDKMPSGLIIDEASEGYNHILNLKPSFWL